MVQVCGRMHLSACFVLALLQSISSPAFSRQAETTNPFDGDPVAIEQGQQFFRLGCTNCHGMNGRGTRGPDLTDGQWAHGGSDAELFQTIMQGVPGTEMEGVAAFDSTDEQVWSLVAYLRTLSGPESDEPDRGDTVNGETLFWGRAGCGGCHMVQGRGGRLGPDLSRIGISRSQAALAESIRTPSSLFPAGYWPVTVVTPAGARIRGVRKNEDVFSVQIMDTSEQIRSFDKRQLVEVVAETRSLMPDYSTDRLTNTELDDLIRYLRSVGAPAADLRE